jgi:S-adenosylmethionine:tRNA ribosyltransferase-isomerase
LPNIKHISIADFNYDLPETRIAMHPLNERDRSKLLIWKDGNITEDIFLNISSHIPEKSLLIFNNSKVIQARLRFTKHTGSLIEIFCLEPLYIHGDYAVALNARQSCVWKCMVGGLSKWKSEALEMPLQIGGKTHLLEARLLARAEEAHEIKFSWEDDSLTFGEILEHAGDIPLPPYIKRSTAADDKNRYQTIYADLEGSVAAPTAGLHFTENIFESFSQKKISQAFVSLHVGAGTFRPVKAATMEDHDMHAEWTSVSIETIRSIANQQYDCIAVGTTSLRTLESLYWLGVKVLINPELDQLDIKQWDVYDTPLCDTNIKAKDALQALIDWMTSRNVETLNTQTQLLIAPGYRFRVADALVTNFHQPQSTLLLLVAAAIGDAWKACYQYALENEFRFLSYGDGSLIFMEK